MGPACDLRAYKRAFRMEYAGIDFLQCIPPLVVVSVSAGVVKAPLAHSVFLHGLYDFQLIILRDLIDLFKTLFQFFLNLPAKRKNILPNSNLSVYCFYL